MAKKLEDDLSVTIPLKRLERLIEAAEQTPELIRLVQQLTAQQAALRGQFLEVMEHLREIEHYL